MMYYLVSVLSLLFVRCPCMAINVSVQYNVGLLPGIILLTQCYYHRGTRLNAMKRFCICSLWSHVINVLIFFPLTGGCSEGLGAFRIFVKPKFVLSFNFLSLKKNLNASRPSEHPPVREENVSEKKWGISWLFLYKSTRLVARGSAVS